MSNTGQDLILNRSRFLSWALAAVMLLALAACGSESSSKKPASPAAEEASPVPVRVLLSLMPEIQYIGIHRAEGLGYYRDKNLSTEFIYSEPNHDNVATVLAGEAQFTVTSADRVLESRSRGEPLVAVIAIYQRDPTALISLKSKDIHEPSDLVGKKILLWGDSVSFQLFAQAADIPLDQVTLVYPEQGQSVMGAAMLFLSGEVDAMVAPGTDVSVQFASIGIKTDALFLDDYGVANYINLIVTTEQMIQEQPDVVQRFVSATLLGLHNTIDEPQATASWFVEYYHDELLPQQLESQDEALMAVLPLFSPAGSKPGVMTRDAWAYIFRGGVALGLFDPALDFTQAYTLQFVDSYYASAQRP